MPSDAVHLHFLGVVVIERLTSWSASAFLVYTGVTVFVLVARTTNPSMPDDAPFQSNRAKCRSPRWAKMFGQRTRVATPLLAVSWSSRSPISFCCRLCAGGSGGQPGAIHYFRIQCVCNIRSASLYFLCQICERFRYLKLAISVLLAFVGAKMMFSLVPQAHPGALLIMLVITVAIVASVIDDRKH